MREIKYKAFDKRTQYTAEVEGFRNKPDGEIEVQYKCDNGDMGYAIGEKENIALMQSTGLKDKNGKEIYEGDIVRVMDNTFAIVKYSDDRGAYYLDCEKKIGDVGLICQYDTIKRVGNIHDNPELLESEE